MNFFDNAWEYNEGRSEEFLVQALEGRRDKVLLMTKVCTHGRGKDVALQQWLTIAAEGFHSRPRHAALL